MLWQGNPGARDTGIIVHPKDATKVADAIVRGLQRGSETVWVPPTLRYVMSALRPSP